MQELANTNTMIEYMVLGMIFILTLILFNIMQI